MATLPFVVQPRRKPIIERIGTEESGIIEIERRGYLTTGEKAFVQQVQQFDNSATEIVATSRRIARKHSLSLDRAYTIVLAIISGSKEEEKDRELIDAIEEEFNEDLSSVVKSLASSQVRESLVFAACMIQYRVNTEFKIEDISSIHPDIVEGLAALYRDEEKRSIEAFLKESKQDERKPSIEEEEKKPVKATGSRSKNTTGD